MKRVKCPQCGSQIMFDESKFVAGQKVLFVCEDCGRKFRIRFGLSQLKDNPTDEEGRHAPVTRRTDALPP